MLSDEIRSALLSDPSRAAKQDRAFLRFRCPRHEDSNPSAWMKEGAWGCFACDFEEPITTLAAEVGVELRGTGPGLAPAVRQRRQIATHPYREANGATRYFRDRFDSKPKVQPRRLDGVRTMEGVDPLLYRLPELIAAREQNREILFVEGESCCDVLAEHGFEATTSGGVTSWRSDFAEHFRGARVVLWPDADEPGERFAGTVAADLAAVVKELRVLRFDGKPKGWDAADFFAEGGKPEQLDVLLADAPPWHPVTPEAETNGLRILTDSEIENVPKPDWLWENRLPMMALAVLFGPPGAGKS